MDIDITGNWRETAAWQPFIQVREPALAPGELRTFHQQLVCPGAGCRLELEYRPSLDWEDGMAVGGRLDRDFEGLAVNGSAVRSLWRRVPAVPGVLAEPAPGSVSQGILDGGNGRPPEYVFTARDAEVYVAACPLDGLARGDVFQITLRWGGTRPPRTRLAGVESFPADSRFQALPPSAGPGELLVAHGLPFLANSIDYSNAAFHVPLYRSGAFAPWDGRHLFGTGDVAADRLHFLGMIHLFDRGNGSWYTMRGDHGYEHFAGDTAGEIVLEWGGGQSTAIPLIFGFNLWYSRPWDLMWCYRLWGSRGENLDGAFFGGAEEPRRVLRDGLALVDGIRPEGALSANARYIFSVALDGRPLRGLRFNAVPELHFHPLVSAVTVETRRPVPGLAGLPALCAESANPRAVPLADIGQARYAPAIGRTQHTLYTFVDEVPDPPAPVIPAGYTGPGYVFDGTREARIAAHFLYRNGPECGSYIADRGMMYPSPIAKWSLPSYQYVTGLWHNARRHYDSTAEWFETYRTKEPGGLPGVGSMMARGAGQVLREAMAFGYGKFVPNYVDWLDGCLFKDVTPPHWTRLVGTGDSGRRHRVGDVFETGFRENDGHGNCMWARYMVWHWLGRPREWNERHFAATAASVDWIRWQLDMDTLRPGVRKDVLFSESECADEDYDICSTWSCLHGLKLAVRLAAQLGRTAEVAQWTALYRRLRQGVFDHLVDPSAFGPVWHTDPTCDWQDHAHKLVPLHLATEGDTYTPLDDGVQGDDADRWALDISLNTYRYLMKERSFDFLRAYGYGQGMMAQAALLLDRMGDATQFVGMLLRHLYLPHPDPWSCPEGIILHRSGRYYMPHGYDGTDSHVVEATKAARIMLGVDDNDPDHLRLLPRFPAEWTEARIKRWPVLTGTARQFMDYSYLRADGSEVFEYSFDAAPPALSIRLGPYAASRVRECRVNGTPVDARLRLSGDSHWLWVRAAPGRSGRIDVCVEGSACG
jgi:hypothetical protein